MGEGRWADGGGKGQTAQSGGVWAQTEQREGDPRMQSALKMH